jgi:hypothetical protein
MLLLDDTLLEFSKTPAAAAAAAPARVLFDCVLPCFATFPRNPRPPVAADLGDAMITQAFATSDSPQHILHRLCLSFYLSIYLSIYLGAAPLLPDLDLFFFFLKQLSNPKQRRHKAVPATKLEILSVLFLPPECCAQNSQHSKVSPLKQNLQPNFRESPNFHPIHDMVVVVMMMMISIASGAACKQQASTSKLLHNKAS